jgi:two-component system response regulator QseB
MYILLVEDDELLGDGIKNGLTQMGDTVDWVQDGKTAQDVIIAPHSEFDAVILDVGLPGLSGLEVLKNIRQRGITTPVLLLTARESVDDRVKGLDAGADDYLTKPFDLSELSARLRALRRRAQSRATPKLIHGELELDPAAHMVTYQGEEVVVSRREFALLFKLVENAGRVLSRDQLNQTLYGWGDAVDSNALEVHIHNLRKRFGSDLIRTIRGVGYIVEKKKEK